MPDDASIWQRTPDPDYLNRFSEDTLFTALGMQCTAVGDDYVEVSMPVDHRTVQPFRILHGGASLALAESLGSVASVHCIDDPERYTAVGVEINANHLRPVPEGGTVTGRVTPIKIGRRMHVWHIEIRNEAGKLVCVSRLTIAIVERRS